MAGFFWSLLGILGGMLVAVQAPVNAALAKGLGLTVAAAAVSFLVGAVVLMLVTAVTVATSSISLDWRAPSPWLFVAGGVLGAGFVTSTTLLTPRLGAAAVMAFLVAGQLLAGMLIDRAGLLGVAVREISLGRVAGALLLLTGALLIRLT